MAGMALSGGSDVDVSSVSQSDVKAEPDFVPPSIPQERPDPEVTHAIQRLVLVNRAYADPSVLDDAPPHLNPGKLSGEVTTEDVCIEVRCALLKYKNVCIWSDDIDRPGKKQLLPVVQQSVDLLRSTVGSSDQRYHDVTLERFHSLEAYEDRKDPLFI